MGDVSAVADPNTGEGIIFQGFWYQAGGTSLSAPLIAGVYAQSGNLPAGVMINSLVYQNPSAFTDITSGSNGNCNPNYLCNGMKGFDGPTGLGTPYGVGGF
jgi:subtilase family serine protease